MDEMLHEMDVPRLATNMRIGTRADRELSPAGELRSVRDELAAG